MSSTHVEFARDRVIVMSAPNGARRSAVDHAALPVSAAELADCAGSLVAEGVSVLHLHVRDDQGGHTLAADRYREAIRAVRERVGDDLILQVTTEAVGIYSREQQMDTVRVLKPDAVSLALREICPAEAEVPEAAAFFAWLRKKRIWPQYILYSADDVRRFDDLRRRGVFAADAPFCLLVMGRYSDRLEGELSELDTMLAAADCREFPWAACCFGRRENDAMVQATRKGGHVRIGFENNLCLSNGTPARDNAELISQYRLSVAAMNRRPATAAEIRNEFLND